MKINVIGLGYIGLPTALIFAANGVEVIGTDYNKDIVDTLANGDITFKEEGLKELYIDATSKGVTFDTKYHKADCYIVAVPTPYNEITKKIESNFVVQAVKEILKICDKNSIIVVESTVSPGTIKRDIEPLISNSDFILNKDLFLAHAPERIIPGNMIYELKHNSRTIGCDDKDTAQKIADLYGKITDGKVITTTIKTAEMSKVVENTYRAVNIAFANELLKLCDYTGIDVYELIRICNMHPRVKILNPGPGVGGHCIPVDPWFLVGDYPEHTKLINIAMETNSNMPYFVKTRIEEIMSENNITSWKDVGLYGLSYKEDVDDYRESPTLQLLKILPESISTFDPMIEKSIVEGQTHDFNKFISKCKLIVVMVKHSHLLNNQEDIKNKILLDTQHCLNANFFNKKYNL